MAAAPRLRQVICPWYVDELNGQAQCAWTTLDQEESDPGPYDDLLTAAAALSRAAMIGYTLQSFGSYDNAPSSGPYSSVRDQAVFTLTSDDYTKLIAIPAPQEDIFIPGSTEVDMSNSLVSAFIGNVISVLGNTYGGPWIQCTGGRRRRVRIGGS